MHSQTAVAVTQQGWSVSSYLLATLNFLFGAGGLGALGVWLKTRPKMREITQTAEDKLTENLMKRVEKIELDAATAFLMREAERAAYESTLKIMRHRLNNSEQCLDALLLLLKTAPERVDQAVLYIEEMRERQRIEIAAEKGAQAHAAVVATAAIAPKAP